MIRGFRLRRLFAVCALAAVCASPARAEDGEPSTAYTGMVGVGAALCTLVYSPLKVVYATTGAVVTGLAFLWSFDTGVTSTLWRTTVGGDYVVTPAVLEGQRDLRFRGGD